MKIKEFKWKWLTTLRLRFTPFIQSNNDSLFFLIVFLLISTNLFSSTNRFLFPYHLLGILVSLIIYRAVTKHKMVLAILLPIWGEVLIYRLYFQIIKGGLADLNFKHTLFIIVLPYVALWFVNKHNPHLSFARKIFLFVIAAVVTIFAGWIFNNN